MESILEVYDKFINHLHSLERMLDFNNVIIDKFLENEDEEYDYFDVTSLFVNYKFNKIQQPGADFKEIDNKIEKLKNEDAMIKFIYDDIEVNIITNEDTGEEEEEVIIKNPVIKNFFFKEAIKRKEISTDLNHLNNSIIISIVTSLELLIADIFKDFLINIDQSNSLSKKSIKLDDLLKLNDIEEAKQMLIDQYVEGLIRGSFENWMSEIKDTLKINLNKIQSIKESKDVLYIQETIQRRHLLIHNGGKVNGFYLSNVSDEIIEKEEISLHEKLPNTPEYIRKRIKLIQKFGTVLLYKYISSKYKGNKSDLFGELNSNLLKLATEGCEGARIVYKDIINHKDIAHEIKTMCEVNYYLSYKINGEIEKVEHEVRDFETQALSIEYKMAKSILLNEKDKSIELFKNYTYTIGDEDFISVIDWPLIKEIREYEEVESIISKRLDRIMNIKEGMKIEDIN